MPSLSRRHRRRRSRKVPVAPRVGVLAGAALVAGVVSSLLRKLRGGRGAFGAFQGIDTGADTRGDGR